MKIFVKTLKGTSFEIEVKPEDKVETVKGIIETTQGANVYPAALQMLIHQGKVLKDGTTLDENKIAENAFVVIMLSKNKVTQGEGSTTSSAPTVKNKVSQGEGSMTSSAPTVVAPRSGDSHPTSAPVSTTPQPPAAVPAPATVLAPAHSPAPVTAANAASDVYEQAASNLVAGNNLEGTIQQIIDMGGGTWDRDTVVRALRAAFNNPERAVDYLYSGIPESAEAPAATGGTAVNAPAQPQEAVQGAPDLSSGPNADPLNLFPQGLPNMGPNAGGANTLEFLRNTPQFQALREMVQANPQILQPMLQELGKQNPQLVRLIQDHQADFLRLINEPIEGDESNVEGQLPGAVPQAVTVTPEEREAIERLEAMGFDRAIVLQVFFACSKNEELAANYLLDHIHEFEE